MESRMALDINQLEAEGLVTIAEDSEGVDFLSVQEWVEGLNMATHLVIWDVGDPGWVRSDMALLYIPVFFSRIDLLLYCL